MNSAQTLNLARKHHQAGDLRQAARLYQQILQAEPRHADALHLFGVIHHQVGRHDLAIQHIRSALQEKPNLAAAHCNLGCALQSLGQLDEAIASFRQALHLDPDYPEAHNNLGIALRLQDKPAEAVDCFQEALRLRPGYGEALANMGLALQKLGRLDEAVGYHEEALRHMPTRAEVHNNLGFARYEQGKLAEAAACYDQALRLQPNFAEAHFNRALQLLLQGNFAEGWPEYEWRWRSRNFPVPPSAKLLMAQTLWDGSPLQGRVILVHAEQGLGDTIQFARYAALLKRNGAGKVLLLCPPELQRLMQLCPGIDHVFTQPPFPAFDVGAFLLSLPRLLGTVSVDYVPAHVPYLDCDQNLVKHWEARLTALGVTRPNLRVGIAWQGSLRHPGDHWRSLPPELFAPLAQKPGVRLISLQKGPGSEQLDKIPGQVLAVGSEFSDLADTAALIRCLDLVISVDTVLVHLAGALGVPVWVALPKVPDWRWLLQRQDSPWYPSMRLFRQSEPGQWADVSNRIKIALDAFAPSSGDLTSVE